MDSGRIPSPKVERYMQVMKYLKSAVFPKDYPQGDRPEIAVAGRSNAGKSSFLNAVNGNKVAKVSQIPGKTRLLNFFDVKDNYRFVDMPGYGFASRSGDEIREWTSMIETYLSTRGTLKGLIIVMDIRREWSKDEELLKKFCQKVNVPVCILASKTDKCTKNEIAKFISGLKKQAQLSDVFPISGIKGTGVIEAEDFIFESWIKPNLKDFKR